VTEVNLIRWIQQMIYCKTKQQTLSRPNLYKKQTEEEQQNEEPIQPATKNPTCPTNMTEYASKVCTKPFKLQPPWKPRALCVVS
jgi:hypothetical protein